MCVCWLIPGPTLTWSMLALAEVGETAQLKLVGMVTSGKKPLSLQQAMGTVRLTLSPCSALNVLSHFFASRKSV